MSPEGIGSMNTQPRILGGRYRLGPALGRGGMAEVNRAFDMRLQRDVAIKQLRVDLASDPTFQARFRREAHSAAGLNHPNIVAVYDTDEEKDPQSGEVIPYIVMELVEGRTLRQIMSGGDKFTPERALEIIQGVLDALGYSHRAGIVHRDIKPGNIMLTDAAGQVKVMDFGIARAVADTQATMTQTAAVIGTAQYLSPEQARGEKVDHRSDLYSTGCVLYELLTGRPPFVGDSPVSVAYQHVREQPVPPSTMMPELSPAIDALVLKSLAKDPQQRYQTAREFSDDISRVLAGQMPLAALAAAPAAAAMAAAELPAEAGIATRTMPEPSLTPEAATDTAPQRALATTDDEEPGEGDEPPGRRRRTVLWTVLGTVLVALLVFGGFFLASNAGRLQRVTVPDVVTMSQETAVAELTKVGLKADVQAVEGPDDDTVGHVTKTEPVAGTKVDPDSTVVVTVNSGPAKLTIPDGLVGSDVDDAEQKLHDAGFTDVKREADDNSDADPDEVTSVKPSSGQQATADTTITVTYSSGTVEVPDWRGQSQSTVESQAKSLGLTNVSLSYETTSQVAPGTVIRQEPAGGTRIRRDGSVWVYIARAPEPSPSPSPTQTSEPPTTTPPTTGTSPSPTTTTPTTDTSTPATTSPGDNSGGDNSNGGDNG